MGANDDIEVKGSRLAEVADIASFLYMLKDRTDGFYEFTKLSGERADMLWDGEEAKIWNTEQLLEYELYALNQSNLNQYTEGRVSFYDLHDTIENLHSRYGSQQKAHSVFARVSF